jgi:hypothetical protein
MNYNKNIYKKNSSMLNIYYINLRSRKSFPPGQQLFEYFFLSEKTWKSYAAQLKIKIGQLETLNTADFEPINTQEGYPGSFMAF